MSTPTKTPPALPAPTPPAAAPVRDIDDLPVHGPFEDRQQETARAIHKDSHDWQVGGGVSW
jgi:hypothetical protein